MFSGNLLLKNIRQIKRLRKTRLHDHKKLVALNYSDKKKCKTVTVALKKFSIPHETEDLILFLRLIVPMDAVKFLDGFVSRFSVITKKQLPEFVQMHLGKKTKMGWHRDDSPALKAVLNYRYFIVDYVQKHISLYAEALRSAKFLPDKK